MDTHRLVISSVHRNLEKVLVFLQQVGEQEGWPAEFMDKLLLVGSEAATNAMDHGNQFDPTKDVMMDLWLEKGSVIMAVEDQGSGFKRDEVDNPLDDENLFNTSGRGLFIIEQMSEGVRYEADGRRVLITLGFDSEG